MQKKKKKDSKTYSSKIFQKPKEPKHTPKDTNFAKNPMAKKHGNTMHMKEIELFDNVKNEIKVR